MDKNIFEKYGGGVDIQAMNAHWAQLRSYVHTLREELDEKTFPLDAYLAAVYEVLGAVISAFDAGTEGFESGMSPLFRMLRHLNGDTVAGMEQHTFLPVAKEYYEQNQRTPLPIDRSKMVVDLFPQYIQHVVSNYEAQCAQRLEDTIREMRLDAKRDSLADLVGEAKVDRLNDLLLRHRLFLSPVRIYAQGLLENMVMAIESSFDRTGATPI